LEGSSGQIATQNRSQSFQSQRKGRNQSKISVVDQTGNVSLQVAGNPIQEINSFGNSSLADPQLSYSSKPKPTAVNLSSNVSLKTPEAADKLPFAGTERVSSNSKADVSKNDSKNETSASRRGGKKNQSYTRKSAANTSRRISVEKPKNSKIEKASSAQIRRTSILFPPMDNTVDSMLETTDLEQQVLEVV
jgi:hypothetical protein